jgi:8-oxo-dGTP diphosphatase
MKRYSGIIVRNEDKYLLCKRNYEGNLPGVWSVPGGHMEDNETPEECARREFFEETNYKIDGRLNLVGFIEHTRW